MKRKLIIILLFALSYLGILFHQGCKDSSQTVTVDSRSPVDIECPPPATPFPSYRKEYGPPDWWCKENKINEKDFPVFQLSQNYPESYDEYIKTDCPETECTWKKDENNFWKQNRKIYGEIQNNYLKEVIKYAFEGNLEVDWIVQKNTRGRKWFHAPYMHLDIVDPLNGEKIIEKVAREFIHGLTLERPGCLSELNYQVGNHHCPFPPKDPDTNFQSWAVSFYNERGASYIGKVWDEMLNPKSRTPNPQSFPAEGFPDGTVGIKLLFTQAPPDKVEYLAGSVEWEADTADFIREGFEKTKRVKEEGLTKEFCRNNPEKCFTKLRLLQIDVAVRDKNSPVGWVFATFTYDKNAKPFIDYTFSTALGTEEIEKKRAWLRIKPLGLMFGNDPNVLKGGDIKESLLNTELEIPQHYGCGAEDNPLKRRLSGPVDNPKSSCISCHSQSETPKNLNIGDVPYYLMKCENEADIIKWFRNINPRNSVDPTFNASTRDKPMFSLDYSLQLREGLRRYCVESYQTGDNKCGVTFEKGKRFTATTKEGTKTFTIQ
jgi:hypothetical protein